MFIAPKASFTRPANTTQYAQNELVANDVDAADVNPLHWDVGPTGGGGRVNAVRLFTDNEAVTTATFNLHLFSHKPVPTNGDNGAFAVSTARGFIGTVACDLATGAFVTTTDKAKRFAITGGLGFQGGTDEQGRPSIWGLIETAATATYTPASGELFEVTLEIEAH